MAFKNIGLFTVFLSISSVVEDDELREDINSMGFPIIHKHKLCCLRQELVDSFVEARYFMFIRYAAFHLQQLSAKRQRDEQKPIEASKDAEKESIETEDKKTKDKKEKDSAKEEESKESEKETKDKEDEILLNDNYSDIDTDVAKKIVESITDSICSGDKQESDL